MRNPLKIGLTGGIASGKSQVSRLFAEKSIDIIDADQIARDLFQPKAPILGQLRSRFGSSIFDQKGQLRRKALAEIVFSSTTDLLWLNQLTHPHVTEKIKRQIRCIKSPYVILDIPLLIDKEGKIPAHLVELIDRILVIEVCPATQISRLVKRDNISEELAETILDNQSTLEQKKLLADDLINNEGSLVQLESQVTLLHNKYMELSKK